MHWQEEITSSINNEYQRLEALTVEDNKKDQNLSVKLMKQRCKYQLEELDLFFSAFATSKIFFQSS